MTVTIAGIQLQFTPVLLMCVLSTAITLGLTVYGVRRHYTGDAATETTLALVGTVLSVSVWTVARSLGLLFAGRALSRSWLSVVYRPNRASAPRPDPRGEAHHHGYVPTG